MLQREKDGIIVQYIPSDEEGMACFRMIHTGCFLSAWPINVLTEETLNFLDNGLIVPLLFGLVQYWDTKEPPPRIASCLARLNELIRSH